MTLSRSPAFGVRIGIPRLELRGATDDLLDQLAPRRLLSVPDPPVPDSPAEA